MEHIKPILQRVIESLNCDSEQRLLDAMDKLRGEERVSIEDVRVEREKQKEALK